MTPEPNGWEAWGRHVLGELGRLSAELGDLRSELAELRVELAQVKTRVTFVFAVLGPAGGIAAALIGALIGWIARGG